MTTPQTGSPLDSIIEKLQAARQPMLGFTPRWSEIGLKRLRNDVATENEQSLIAQFATIQLRAVEGAPEEAISLLGKLLSKYSSFIPHNNFFYQNIIFCLLAVGQPECVAKLVDFRLNCSDWLKIDFDAETNQPASVAQWIAHSPKRSRFTFSPDLYGLPRMDMYIRNWLSCLPAFQRYGASACFATGKVSLSLGDIAVAAGLAFCGSRSDIHLIPDPYFLWSLGYADIRKSYAANDVAWAERQAVAFWRGASTGRLSTKSADWRTLPRVKLCLIAQSRPDIFDAGLHRVIGISDVEAIKAAGLMGHHVPDTSFNRYRYQIDIDGVSNSWPGLFIKLLTGSPVLKIASPHGFRQWYYERLEPWVNFVPVAADMSDLIEKVEWLRNNDEQACKIGERGKELAGLLLYETEVKNCSETFALAMAISPSGPGEPLA